MYCILKWDQKPKPRFKNNKYEFISKYICDSPAVLCLHLFQYHTHTPAGRQKLSSSIYKYIICNKYIYIEQKVITANIEIFQQKQNLLARIARIGESNVGVGRSHLAWVLFWFISNRKLIISHTKKHVRREFQIRFTQKISVNY